MITEDDIVEYVDKQKGLLITRKKININEFNYNIPLICLTGYNQIIGKFYNEILPNFSSKVVIVIIETDDFILTEEMASHPLIKHIYCWNKPLNHPNVSAIPIGLNYDRQHNVLVQWLEQNKETKLHNKLLCVNYSPNTNSIRGSLIQKANTGWNDFCDIIEFIPNQNEYWKHSYIEGKIKITVTNPKCYVMMSQYKFVLSPPGAGMDCHRTWEALYIGCIPIVITSKIDELYEELPIVVVNDWNEITKEFLERKYDEIMKNKQDNIYNMEKLELKYWTDLINTKTIKKNGITLINYANKSHYESQYNNKKSALINGDIDRVFCLGPNDIDSDFKDKYSHILQQRRGAGYWLWKPYLILKYLKERVNYDEILIYSDSGVTFLKSFLPVIELMDSLKTDIGCFEIIQVEKKWTKRDLFITMGLDKPEYTDTFQRMASYQVIRKTQFTLKFYEEYLNLCTIEHNITDTSSVANNYDSFKEHRHDQSIFSLLTKKYNIPCMRDPCQWNFEGNNGVSKAPGNYGVIINHHRNKR